MTNENQPLTYSSDHTWRGNCSCGKWLVIFSSVCVDDPVVCLCGRKYYVLPGDAETSAQLICDTSNTGIKPIVHQVRGEITRKPVRVIGIAGWKGSGKDTVARMICRPFSGWYKISLADAVRDVASRVYGFKHRDMLHPVRKEEVDPLWGIKRRQGLINIGQGMREACQNDIWVKSLHVTMNRIKTVHFAKSLCMYWGICMVQILFSRLVHHQLLGWCSVAVASVLYYLIFLWCKRGPRFVIPDIRFQTEVDDIRKMGGELWCVYRPGKDWDGTDIEDLPNHRDLFDRIVRNSGTRKQLGITVRILYRWAMDGIQDGVHRAVGE